MLRHAERVDLALSAGRSRAGWNRVRSQTLGASAPEPGVLRAPVPVTELFPQQPQGLQRYGTVALVSIAFDASVRSVENLNELLVVTMMLRNL
jgi:hypothetical protein